MAQSERPHPEEVLRRFKLSRTEPAPDPKPEQVHALAAESRSGEGSKAPEEVLRLHRAQATHDRAETFGLEEPPWLRALVEKKASDDEVIDAIAKRLQRAPTRETLLAAKALARDLAKRSQGRPLRKILTQEMVNELIQKRG
jgi:hypothetical protein